ncbi:glycoside hydrolase family 113 [Lacticaseibacillus suihuaensis]
MNPINAVTYGYTGQRGDWSTLRAQQSLRLLHERTGANTVILAVTVTQPDAFTPRIDWQSPAVLRDAEVLATAAAAQAMGMAVILKPMVNLEDGVWRAHINFFDHDAPCEPTWGQWFTAYTAFMTHYAELAEQCHASMLVIGCELVNADRRAGEWRALIAQLRRLYHGKLTYNCDKYQEDAVSWWDAVDVISSSGYYPIDAWSTQLPRIQAVVERFGKPFFFCEAGCPARRGAALLPNDWTRRGALALDEQAAWYRAMFAALRQAPWVAGVGLWDWKADLYPVAQAATNDDYALYGKPAEAVVLENFAHSK